MIPNPAETPALTPAMVDPLLLQASQGAMSEALLAHLMPVLEQLEADVDKRVMRALSPGPLDPDLAVQAWIEKAGYKRLRNSLLIRARVGHNAEVRVEHLLHKGPSYGRQTP